MARKEEIQKQAEKKAFEPSRLMHPYAKQHKVMSAYEIGYIEGAVWADEHPDIDVRTMAAWQSGYKEAIEKACEWLKEQLQNTTFNGEPLFCEIEETLEDFRKAMKGDSQ